MKIFEELKARGLIAQMTHEDEIQDMLNNQQTTFYTGYDPTADSLHVGHFLQLTVMSRLQKAGHKPIVLLGGGTTMIGDPSGKSDMRKMMTQETIAYNAECFKKQMAPFIDFGEGKAIMVNNADWLLNLNYIEFLREIGVHFTVNRMLAAEAFKSRWERGLSFFEFNYMIMQSYDFLMLYRNYGCSLQLGGDDQWSNILSGADLIRRVERKPANGMTFTLLTTSDGRKMGKTEKGAVWLDPQKTSPYEFYQYWRNIDDADVVRVMKLLTFMTLDEIKEYESLSGSAMNEAKERLAFEITRMVHGEQNAEEAVSASKSLFAGAGEQNAPEATLCEGDLTEGKISILDLLVKADLSPSKSEARRLVLQGGVTVDGEKVDSIDQAYDKDKLNAGVMVRKGKKSFKKVSLK